MIKKNTMNRTAVIIGLVTVIALIVSAVILAGNTATVRAEETANEYQTIVRAAEGDTTEEETTESTESTVDNSKGTKAIAAAIVVGLASAAGALAMGFAIAKSNEAISRQPEASSKISSGLMLGLVFIETAIIYALIVAILVIFVL